VDVVNDETLRHMHLGGIKGSAESLTLKHIGGKYTLYSDEDTVLTALINRRIEGVLYDEITLNYYKNHDYKGRITTYPTNYKRFFFAFGLPKKSPIRDNVNYALLTLMEKSDWPYLLKRYGLEENFEEKQAPSTKRGKISH
jgi:ABC-type amino acid transport substrate-binding protein